MKEEKRCLKVTMYIYLPKQNNTLKNLRYFATRLGVGRIMIHNEDNSKTSKMLAFTNLGQALNMIMDAYYKRSIKRVKAKLP